MAAQAAPQSVPAPRITVNDSWTYHHTEQNHTGWHDSLFTVTVRRVGANDIVVAVTPRFGPAAGREDRSP